MSEKVLITGASGGLGEQMARLFAERGADLVITGRRTDRLGQVRTEIVRAFPERTVVPLALDVTEHDKVIEVFEHAATVLGRLDRIVVNAGLGKGTTIGSGRISANRDTVVTNFVGGLAQCEAGMRVLYRQGRGQLVVVSSVVAARGMAGPMNAYAASKVALAHLAEGIRSDVRSQGLPITVTTLRPGYIDSDMQTRTGRRHPLLTASEPGCRALVEAIVRGADDVCVPRWPWSLFALGLKSLPSGVVRRMV